MVEKRIDYGKMERKKESIYSNNKDYKVFRNNFNSECTHTFVEKIANYYSSK